MHIRCPRKNRRDTRLGGTDTRAVVSGIECIINRLLVKTKNIQRIIALLVGHPEIVFVAVNTEVFNAVLAEISIPESFRFFIQNIFPKYVEHGLLNQSEVPFHHLCCSQSKEEEFRILIGRMKDIEKIKSMKLYGMSFGEVSDEEGLTPNAFRNISSFIWRKCLSEWKSQIRQMIRRKCGKNTFVGFIDPND